MYSRVSTWAIASLQPFVIDVETFLHVYESQLRIWSHITSLTTGNKSTNRSYRSSTLYTSISGIMFSREVERFVNMRGRSVYIDTVLSRPQ